MLTAIILLSLLAADPVVASPPRPAGFRAELTGGQLFVPAEIRIADWPLDLLVHLHGSPELMERNLHRVGTRTILVTVSLNGLSSVYSRRFAMAGTFLQLIEDASRQTARELGLETVVFRRVTLSSFSAGFGGVRELLKSEECYRRLDGIIMADSIYAGYAEDSKDRNDKQPAARQRAVDQQNMAGFLRFARDAVAGRKKMVISHCQLQPDGYASTAETADYLLRELGVERRAVSETWEEQWQCESRCERGSLHVFGFAGTAGADHMRHLRNIGRLWEVGSR